MVKIRKSLTSWGASKGIVIPDFWLDSIEILHGERPTKIDLDIEDDRITITPVLEGGKTINKN